MKDAARLQAVIDVCDMAAREARPSDTLISAYFRANRYIGSKDRQVIASMAYDMLRFHARLHWWQKRLGAEDNARILTLLYLALIKEETAEAITALFSGDKFAPVRLNQNETRILRELEGRTLLHPDMDEATRLECPDWAYERFRDVFGDKLQAELQAMQEAAPLDVRVNPLKGTREQVAASLKKEDIIATPSSLSPLGLRVEGRPALAQTESFKNGLVEIQDEGSQMVALLLDAQPGESVVDFCAGAGGKTLALAAAMQNKGRVVACDVLEKRLMRARERFRRAGLHNIELHPLKNENDPWVKRNAGKYDRVLVDAPCSGTGTWRRNPDARWKKLGPGLDELLPLQQSILASAARLVKAGGYLVYATCSLLPDENQKQVETFLAAHPAFSLEKANGQDYLLLTPAQHGTDGFFAARMKKL